MLEFSKSPWLEIPPRDYEGHMGSEGVRQLAFLNSVFRQAIKQQQPSSLLILGCATGNGLEHVDPLITRRVVGVDVHKEYLEIAESRHRDSLPDLELHCLDLFECRFELGSFDLIFGGLFFEYVDPRKAVPMVAGWLTAEGRLVAVLQLPSQERGRVTKTAYPSLRRLEPIMTLWDPAHFEKICEASQLAKHQERSETLATGKSFYIGQYGA